MVLCSEGPILRCIQKVLYSENSLFDVGENLHLSASGKLRCKITNPLILAHSVKGQLSFCHGAVSKIAIGTMSRMQRGCKDDAK